MEINKDLARIAIKLKEFQKFMQVEIKITDGQLKELVSCGGAKCWDNFTWLKKTISKINKRLMELQTEGKLKIKNMTSIHRIFTKDEKEELITFIRESDADKFQIFARKKS